MENSPVELELFAEELEDQISSGFCSAASFTTAASWFGSLGTGSSLSSAC
ncbi:MULTISPECIES: hypothetical protein [Lysinibacillus]|nr:MULTISPECIES: hypothetical protein [Lysinibacillus]WDU79257.1 hypothetical protein PSR12_22005 [Lysinibacillus sp. G01H]